jgi:hypothetical protein
MIGSADYSNLEARMLAYFDAQNPYRGWDDTAANEWLEGYIGQWTRDYPDDHPTTQGRRAAIADWRGTRQHKLCDMGVGCDEWGACYAVAQGRPDMCGRG